MYIYPLFPYIWGLGLRVQAKYTLITSVIDLIKCALHPLPLPHREDNAEELSEEDLSILDHLSMSPDWDEV